MSGKGMNDDARMAVGNAMPQAATSVPIGMSGKGMHASMAVGNAMPQLAASLSSAGGKGTGHACVRCRRSRSPIRNSSEAAFAEGEKCAVVSE